LIITDQNHICIVHLSFLVMAPSFSYVQEEAAPPEPEPEPLPEPRSIFLNR
jgi:hypothetical protein